MVDLRRLPRASCAVLGALIATVLPSAAFAAEAHSAIPAIAQSIGSLTLVCVLAALTLRFAARRLKHDEDGSMRVIARLPLEPKRTLLAVRVGTRTMLLASSEAGVHPVGELSDEDAVLLARKPDPEARQNVSRETSEVGGLV